MISVLVTGASGFVGSALSLHLAANGFAVIRAVRRSTVGSQSDSEIAVGSINALTDWRAAIGSCSIIVHTAAHVHITANKAVDSLEEFRRVNVEGTINLATQAAAAGVKRFIYFSSIGVNGSETSGAPFTAEDIPAPYSPYTQSKYEAECALRALLHDSKMQLVIIRAPLVYDSKAPGHFKQLLDLVRKGIPLPFGAIQNRRSFVSLDNLVDFVRVCCEHPSAAGETLLVSDGDDLSTPELIRCLGDGMLRKTLLVPVPIDILFVMASLVGKNEQLRKLCSSLTICIDKTTQLLAWHPPVLSRWALKRAAANYLSDIHKYTR